MKIEVINNNKTIIYINKEYTKDLNLYEKEKLELYFRDLFVKLKDIYEVDIFGYYDIMVYRDINYGGIIILEKEDSEYFSYYGKQIDMCIKIDNNDLFLYQVDDLFVIDKNIMEMVKVYKYKNKLYLRIIDSISTYQMGLLMEQSQLTYGDKVRDIIKYGKVIDYKTISV
jgi:hypothetical protein